MLADVSALTEASGGRRELQQRLQMLSPRGRYTHSAAVGMMFDPVMFEKLLADCSSQGAREMIAPLGPVKATSGEAASHFSKHVDIDLPADQKFFAAWCEIVFALSTQNQHALAQEGSSE